MTTLYVTYDQKITHDYWDGKQFGDWRREYDTLATGVHLSRPSTPYYETVGFVGDKVPDEIYIVAVKYSDGDTFGYSTGHLAIAGAYETFVQADKVVKQIRGGTFESERYLPWTGFFNSLEGVEIGKFVVQK